MNSWPASIIALALAIPGAASGQSLFGIDLKQPIKDIPLCEYQGYAWSFPPEGQPYCIKAREPRDGSMQVNLPATKPGYITSVSIDSIDGRVEHVTVLTSGLESQDEIMAALTRRFSQPAMQRSPIYQNAFGAKFVGREAAWKMKNGATLTFFGVGNSRDYGGIDLASPIYDALMVQQKKAKQQGTLQP